MSPRTFAFAVLLSIAALPLSAQQDGDASAPDPAQKKTARTFAAKAKVAPAAKVAALKPLTPRERALQLLDRFTFGPRPGEVDRVLALGLDTALRQSPSSQHAH